MNETDPPLLCHWQPVKWITIGAQSEQSQISFPFQIGFEQNSDFNRIRLQSDCSLWCLFLGHLWGLELHHEQQDTLLHSTSLMKTVWSMKKKEDWQTVTEFFVGLTKTDGRREEKCWIVQCLWKEAAQLFVTSQLWDITNNAVKPWQLIFKCHPAARLWQ